MVALFAVGWFLIGFIFSFGMLVSDYRGGIEITIKIIFQYIGLTSIGPVLIIFSIILLYQVLKSKDYFDKVLLKRNIK